MKWMTILGARPQFIKAATVSNAIRAFNRAPSAQPIEDVLVHTGQHFDANMSQVFFQELSIPEPKYNLGISACSHGAMTGRMLEQVEVLLEQEKPNLVIVYGDTNSTLAGALAAAKLQIPVAHIESGLRSGNMAMPEEINRILTDRISNYLFCPTRDAVAHLAREGLPEGVNCGDVMYDATLHYTELAQQRYQLGDWQLQAKEYVLATVHRQENTHQADSLSEILRALDQIAQEIPLVLPLHPGTRNRIAEFGLQKMLQHVCVIEPVSYLQMLRLESGASLILTDSGGVQKEAYFQGVPCITLRNETEWLETVAAGVNVLTGANEAQILEAWQIRSEMCSKTDEMPYGEGRAAEFIVDYLATRL
ncbi:UDP-N-acetylglucosamine 2-epimerase [Oleiphilus messinensis]|uniref:UDP-N-acetylglucosamine 2-epimerase n=1 Tax=Oleiphilus messinensis TaxID=141451 RepID=A0A1Y0IG68_9GAMM|nr:UDP-N-acetylglucosamine 2-epimerase (non-hydrolyzing) [Oleiphilus messinensis]ARU59498.1 UDP-N-acetylglucosamine 2-epimerase [Oleiphilus messinensis]